MFIQRARERSTGRLSRIFQKSGKNYRLRMARRIVQTTAGNLDKWRLNDSRSADLLPPPPPLPPPPLLASTRRDKKVSRSNSAECGARD